MTSGEFRLARERMNLTQAQLATALGYGKRQVESYERGEAEIPIVVMLGVATLLHLAKNNRNYRDFYVDAMAATD